MSARGAAALARVDDVEELADDEPSESERLEELCERLGAEECARCGGQGGGEERDPDGRRIGVWIECDSCCGSGRAPCWPRPIELPISRATEAPSEIPF